MSTTMSMSSEFSSTNQDTEYQESTTTSFEWIVRGVKEIFESSKGDAKSKVTKSVKFGGGRWTILFYANAGTGGNSNSTDGGHFISLYLSCEPTQEERDAAVEEKWVRQGVFKFSFAIRGTNKMTICNQKEALNHSFSYKTANWGWAQFARRDAVFFQSNIVKLQDAFVIVCSITSSPAPPVPPPQRLLKSVPRKLLDTVGSLLDDPLYSDVVFILSSRSGKKPQKAKKIYAARKLLDRAEYFRSMFGSGFLETSQEQIVAVDDNERPDASDSFFHQSEVEDSDEESETADEDYAMASETESLSSGDELGINTSPPLGCSAPVGAMAEDAMEDRSTDDALFRNETTIPPSSAATAKESEIVPGPPKVPVVIKDVAYVTYRAVLFYIYTDSIVFAPLSSSFHSVGKDNSLVVNPSTAAISSENSTGSTPRKGGARTVIGAKSRREWITKWRKNNPDHSDPCSAKAAYKLADRYDLAYLKERAFQHIISSLTVDNIAYEMFSSFSKLFADVRAIQIQFFLDHWTEIRSSDSMRTIWMQIRNGRHPGFEDVWQTIASNLEYNPRPRIASEEGETSQQK